MSPPLCIYLCFDPPWRPFFRTIDQKKKKKCLSCPIVFFFLFQSLSLYCAPCLPFHSNSLSSFPSLVSPFLPFSHPFSLPFFLPFFSRLTSSLSSFFFLFQASYSPSLPLPALLSSSLSVPLFSLSSSPFLSSFLPLPDFLSLLFFSQPSFLPIPAVLFPLSFSPWFPFFFSLSPFFFFSSSPYSSFLLPLLAFLSPSSPSPSLLSSSPCLSSSLTLPGSPFPPLPALYTRLIPERDLLFSQPRLIISRRPGWYTSSGPSAPPLRKQISELPSIFSRDDNFFFVLTTENNGGFGAP